MNHETYNVILGNSASVNVTINLNNLITIVVNNNQQHDTISFRDDNAPEIYQYLIKNPLQTYYSMFIPKNKIPIYPKLHDKTESINETLNKMSKIDLLNYIRKCKTYLADSDLLTLTQKLEDNINPNVIIIDDPRTLYFSMVEEQMKKEYIETEANLLNSLNTIKCVTTFKIENDEYLNFINSNIELINKYLDRFKFRFLYNLTIVPYILYENTIAGKIIIQASK
jgi:hypothetical protein